MLVTVFPNGQCAMSARLGGDLGGGFSIDSVYPVGSIYMSVTATDPSILFGGTWERLQNCFLLGASSTYAAGSTGGEEAHTLTASEVPSTTTAIPIYYTSQTQSSYRESMGATTWTNKYRFDSYSNNGGGAAHNNMPPYLAVYMWKRTA